MTDITELAQEARINAGCGEYLSPAETMELVEALDKAQQVEDELCKLLPPGAEYMDPPDGGDVTLLEGVRRMVTDYRQRIAELESRTVKLPKPISVLHRREFTAAHCAIYAYPEAEVNAALDGAGIKWEAE